MVILNCKNGANKTVTINKWLKMRINVSRDANLVFASYIFYIDGNSEIFSLVTWIKNEVMRLSCDPAVKKNQAILIWN